MLPPKIRRSKVTILDQYRTKGESYEITGSSKYGFKEMKKQSSYAITCTDTEEPDSTKALLNNNRDRRPASTIFNGPKKQYD